MKRKRLYIVGAIVAGAILAWLWKRKSSAPISASVSLGDMFAVNSTTYTTPSDLLTPEGFTVTPHQTN